MIWANKICFERVKNLRLAWTQIAGRKNMQGNCRNQVEAQKALRRCQIQRLVRLQENDAVLMGTGNPLVSAWISEGSNDGFYNFALSSCYTTLATAKQNLNTAGERLRLYHWMELKVEISSCAEVAPFEESRFHTEKFSSSSWIALPNVNGLEGKIVMLPKTPQRTYSFPFQKVNE